MGTGRKWRLALDMLEELAGWGPAPPVVPLALGVTAVVAAESLVQRRHGVAGILRTR